ncbi:putative repeat protein (TIGR01451 family) [Povalibacter uvarum]|uniref:Putative repeat protein (TIGR01451 family) n=1 Tax=Povalibacter uvarum TaxID=732238 RepID=A0A841HJY7_9GAMM|nr:hypothetical protein [Povalibacter uvarum]MBB6092894.1 putative repeat protein (TIGR01451 family) [Povalibacter uvarum]
MVHSRWSWLFAGLLVAVFIAAPAAVRAAGTNAGTSIQGTAQATYTFGGPTLTATSNTVTVIVAEILDVVVTVSGTTPVSAGETRRGLVFTITNTGNGTETFDLGAMSAGIVGDDFDPTLVDIYFDTDASNDLSPPDTLYVAGSNDPALAPDTAVRVLVINDIPANVANTARGRSQLTARARTGTGTPGSLFATQGDGGVDALVGTSGAQGIVFGEYVAARMQVAAVKTQTIVDPAGGSRPVAGARIDYQIVVSVNGSGTAPDAIFSDTIPAYTTYVPGTLALNSTVLSDIADGDVGEFVSAPDSQVRIHLGDLTQASGPQTIRFAVTIN